MLPGTGERERLAVSDDQRASCSHIAATLGQQVLEAPNVADEIESLRKPRADRGIEMNEPSKKLCQAWPNVEHVRARRHARCVSDAQSASGCSCLKCARAVRQTCLLVCMSVAIKGDGSAFAG